MKKMFLAGAAVTVAAILAGCGHNAIQYGDGIGFDAGINPENCTVSLNLRYGKILSAVTRDNVEIALSGQAAADAAAAANGSSVNSNGALKVKIGRQINGAAVDLIMAGANAAQVTEYLTAKQ